MPFQCYGVSDMLTDASHSAGVVKDDHVFVLLQFSKVILKQMWDWRQDDNYSMIPDRVRLSLAMVLLLLIFVKKDIFQWLEINWLFVW